MSSRPAHMGSGARTAGRVCKDQIEERSMDVVIRAPKMEDAEGLAQAARDMGEPYAGYEPDRFHVPEAQAQVEWFREVLRKPAPENSIWLVAEVAGEAVGDAQAVLSE